MDQSSSTATAAKKHTDWSALRTLVSGRNWEGTNVMHSGFTRSNMSSSFDAEYRFGRPKVYLTPLELARLAILRSKLGDTQPERLARAAGWRAATKSPASPQ